MRPCASTQRRQQVRFHTGVMELKMEHMQLAMCWTVSACSAQCWLTRKGAGQGSSCCPRISWEELATQGIKSGCPWACHVDEVAPLILVHSRSQPKVHSRRIRGPPLLTGATCSMTGAGQNEGH